MRKVNQLTDNEKYMLKYAQDQWNKQCKDFMLHNTPFKDKTMKDCVTRICPSINK